MAVFWLMLLLYGLPALIGFVWIHFVTTPQERAAIRAYRFLEPPEQPEPSVCPCCGSGRLVRREQFCFSRAVAGVLLTGDPLGANAGLLPATYRCADCGCCFGSGAQRRSAS